ncbi:hypothetical protein BCR32DRAFT_269997 [Anaeromyces robustus]|uniref:Uncharacterized protein n=1 Tax=Anaeromyces robustus TaxID=1754192 RepID=A0A1Y1WZ01_9FUNG|nr:hypothetical protein BCR32DRAFT_269997 [Anaeromyces robustus]|eukprot:ORX78578.1 hypothetical protein BCR32DRAFT_269997 [Anaeromyces robustus]
MSLYIIQKVILNVITCVISGTYAQFHLKEITGGKDVDIEEYKMNRKYKKEEENIISIDKELVSESKINLKNNVDESDNESDEYSILAEMNGQKLLISNNVSQNEKRTILNLLKNMNNIILKDYESTSSNNEDDDISIRQKSKNDDDNENNNSYDDDDITINIYDDYSSSSDEEYSLSTKEKEEEEEEDINNGKVIIIDEEQPDDLIGDDSELIFRGKRFSQDNKVLIFGKVNSNKNYIKKINLYNEKKSKKYNIDDDNNNNQENDETTNDETTNDEITNDEITNDEITNDEITNDENVKNENKNDKKKDKNKKDKNKNDSAKMKARQIKRKEKEKQRKEQIKKILERKNNIIENNRKLAEENNKNFLVRNYFRLSVTDYLGSVSAQVLVNLFFIVVTVIKILIILIITLIAFVIYILLLYFVGYFTGGRGVDRLTSKILKLAYNIIKLLLPFYFPYFSNFIDMIIYGRGYLEAFVSEDNLNAVITATLPVKVIKYAGALHCGFFAGTIALIMCLIFGFPTLHIFPCFVVIFEFLIGIITFQPIISGSQAANYCYYRNKVPVESQDSYIKSFISKDTLNLESNNEFYYEKMTPFLPDIPLKKSKSNQEDNDKLNETNNNNKILKSNIYDDNTEKDNVDSNENVSNNITPSNNTKASNNIEILVQIDDDN